MSKIAIIYWSGTGNTAKMAEAIKEGIESKNVSVLLKEVEQAKLDDVKEADAIVLGSPAMGNEVLALEMEDFVTQIEKTKIKSKVAGAFGSYDWGDGQWMRDFVERLKRDGFDVVGEGLKIRLTPDEEGLEKCRQYGKEIADRAINP